MHPPMKGDPRAAHPHLASAVSNSHHQIGQVNRSFGAYHFGKPILAIAGIDPIGGLGVVA